jgi:hypothetical protein
VVVDFLVSVVFLVVAYWRCRGVLAVCLGVLVVWPFVDLLVVQLRRPLKPGSWEASGECARASRKPARLVGPGVAINCRDIRPSKVNEARQQVLICQANLDFVCRLDVIAIFQIEYGICHADNDRALLFVFPHDRNQSARFGHLGSRENV